MGKLHQKPLFQFLGNPSKKKKECFSGSIVRFSTPSELMFQYCYLHGLLETIKLILYKGSINWHTILAMARLNNIMMHDTGTNVSAKETRCIG